MPSYLVHTPLAFWIVFQGQEPVGYCSVNQSIYDENALFLSSAGILPEHRGNKLHKRMIKARIRFAKKHGYKRVVTYTAAWNDQSYMNLQKYGFKIYFPEEEDGQIFLHWEYQLL
jgi:ribosomal protein S18 acetylase RimI-like enzyme